MKFKHLFFILVAGFFAVSCSSDNDNTPSPSQSAAGTYKGYVIADSQYFKGNITQNETITITANEDGTATVVYTSSSSNWGTSTISAATITAGTNGYTISGTGVSTITSHSTGESANYDCTLTGTISADKSDVEMIFTLPVVMGGTTITYHLGDAPDNQLVAGTYNSYSSAISDYGDMGVYNGESITLKADTENGKVDFTYSGQWGEATAADLEISKEDGYYIVSGSGITTMTGHSGTASNYDFTVEGTISADKSTASFILTISVMGTTIVTTQLGDAPAAMLIAKAYTGTSAITIVGTSYGNIDDHKVTIKAQEDGKAEVTLAPFTIGNMGFTEDIVIEDVEVTVEDDIYTLSAEINTISAGTEVTGSLTGTIEGGVANLVFSLKPSAMPMPIVATFVSE